ncbi:hypothetical protein K402DRAFT_265455 [Aulographum hederae CBS 113979]|uniref:RBR-type E3 ubiquitin transferase n=1 Tax=Aulographum hederae CBS 113979 TaxID=1176131 RepID=A0A6G1GIS9_9PEZI|nr:hypothetical protein K402DRAFT_265455 [Aulographum hederae CBS 113979]
MDANQEYDLLILVDATASMGSYVTSLRTSLPQIIYVSLLTDCFARIGLLAYRDYNNPGPHDLLQWTGWHHVHPANPEKARPAHLLEEAKLLHLMHGGDWPEASKTGFARAYELMREDAITIIFLYTDAAPHTVENGSLKNAASLMGPEWTALRKPTSYGGHGPAFADWVSLCRTLSGKHGEKKAQVFNVLKPQTRFVDSGYYNFLSTVTTGATVELHDASPRSISQMTVDMLISWMDVESAGVDEADEADDETALQAGVLTKYQNADDILQLTHKEDRRAPKYFSGRHYGLVDSTNLVKFPLTPQMLQNSFPKKAAPVADFSKRYQDDEKYRCTVVEQIRHMINHDVAAMSLNIVYGKLWRALCNDRDNPARDELTTAFGLHVERISNSLENARMKKWLEDSYDYTADVLDAINAVPEAQKYPCVCLDPTIRYHTEDEVEGHPLRRADLLEIGRSCDYRILRRLGRVLTRLTYINSTNDMPSHLAASETSPKMPMVLAQPEHGRKFWKMLLHLVIPGTMLASRPAAVLAALSIGLGMRPLLAAAYEEVMAWRDRWNDTKVPETWTMGCLSLLLDADRSHHKHCAEMASICNADGATDEPSRLLKDDDRELFGRLVSYKMLEMNLDTTLTARVGWTPEKAIVRMGPVATCTSCLYPRSVSVMAEDGVCGLCNTASVGDSTEKKKKEIVHTGVSKNDNEETPATWVECVVSSCRAQYVVYRPSLLHVRPKCHYCRSEGVSADDGRATKLNRAPTVECSKCLNRVIYPKGYRPDNMNDFECYACVSGRPTIVESQATARVLSKESGQDWLIQTTAIPLPLLNHSLFHTCVASTAHKKDFSSRVRLFPETSTRLALHGKPLHNQPALIDELKSWVLKRRTQSETCSLCITPHRKPDLRHACGRSGCHQRICGACIGKWYGSNKPGCIINVAALSCPFCRRTPAPKTLHKYGMGIHAVANLAHAVAEQGDWAYAWCRDCGHASRYLERVCARGAPDEIENWVCESCVEVNAQKEGKKEKEKFKMCPGCGTATQKTGGCDHIACEVEGCGTHWCWFCGEGFEEGKIYEHMQDVHGGMYGGFEEEDYDEDVSDDGEFY